MIAFTASCLFTPQERIDDPLLLVDGRTITEISSRRAREVPKNSRLVDFGDAILAPGFVDIHIHGSAGVDVMSAEASGLASLEQFLARHGVTSYLPTTVTAPLEQILSALERLADAVEAAQKDGDRPGARPLGIHLEGPFISHTRRGVHPPVDLLPPTLKDFERFWQAARGHIRMMTIASELPGALEVIAEVASRGVCVSLGHSDADLENAHAAVSAGARHATHTFNAMRRLDHRDPGIVGAILTDQRLTADIIADGVHLDPTIVRIFLQAKGPDHSVLITDATAATGMPDGRYRLGPLDVEVKDGRCTADGKLAGSVLAMDRAVQNIMQFADWDLHHAVCTATLNPARAVGLLPRGSLQAGGAADFVVLGRDGEIRHTVIGGASLPDF